METPAKNTDNITANELVDLLQKYWGLNGDAELARELGVERWSVGQYRKRKGFADIPSRIIINLLRDIDYLENKLSNCGSTAHPLLVANYRRTNTSQSPRPAQTPEKSP